MKEYTKAALESTKTPEFRASFKAHIAERNKNISHEEFVVGLRSGAMGFKCFFDEPFQFLTITQRKAFAVRGWKSASGGFLPFIFVGLGIVEGIRSVDTFYSLCALWSWALFLIAEDYQRRCATQNLITSSALFDDAVANQKVMIVRRDDEVVA
jgi:hypothetical protein